MKIVMASPLPSHPSSNADRHWLQSFGGALVEDGHDITFIYLGQDPGAEALKDMKSFWTSFLHIPGNYAPGGTDVEKIRQAVRILTPDDADILICVFAYMEEGLREAPANCLKISIPLLYPEEYGHDFLAYSQQRWRDAGLQLLAKQAPSHADIVLARTEKEWKILDGEQLAPVLDMREKQLRGEHCLEGFYEAINNKKKKILVVTDRQFWDARHAISSVLLRMFRYLQKRYQLTVYYLGTLEELEWDKISSTGLREYVEASNTPTNYHIEHSMDVGQENMEAFSGFLARHGRFNAVIYEFVTLSSLRKLVPYAALNILDTQDVMSIRRYSMEEELTYDMPLSVERDIYSQFDATLFIEREERDFGGRVAPQTIAVYCPPAWPAGAPPFPETGLHFGFVGSQWILNTESIEWFLANVWPMQDRPDAWLHIFGGVCNCLKSVPLNVVLHGVVESAWEIFGACHIMLNPTLRGSGFPTKSLQAIAHGRPLLATAKGARGLAKTTGNGIYVAHNRAEHVEGMLRLSHDAAMREEFSRKALDYATRSFTYEASFGTLGRLVADY